MSVKKNAFIVVAAAAVGFGPVGAKQFIAEGLLNDCVVTGLDIAQVDDGGGCIVFATVTGPGDASPTVRAVTSSSGDLKVYSGLSAVESVVKRAKIASAGVIRYYKKDKASGVGDPIAGLKSQYKSFKSEAAASLKSKGVIAAKVVAAAALGWDTQTGTPEADEYQDLQDKGETVTEWNAFCVARVTALAAALTAAGVDPATVV